MLSLFSSPEKKRQQLLTKVPPGPLQEYLSKAFPSKGQFVRDTEFLALDFETTGLDAKNEAILSAGWVLVRQGRVVLDQRGHHLVKVNKPIPEKSVIVHKITDDRAREGMHLHNMLERLLPEMAGRVLLVHYQNIEKSFLGAACEQIYGFRPPFLVADTMQVERKRLERRQREITPSQLRLFNLRKQYGLPRYNAHSALEDAIGTAELFLAQTESMSGGKPVKLGEVLA